MRWKRALNVVDSHCEGEIGRVITGGIGQVPGQTMFDKKLWLESNLDEIRKLVLFEPRGAVWHNANIILPSNHSEAAMGYVILETTEYPAMSGSNTICVATVLLETGILPMVEPVTELVLEAPAGLIRVRCECRDGKVLSVRLVNQPAFCYHRDAMVEVAGLGSVHMDVAYGGMTYAMVEAADLGFAIEPHEARDLCDLGQRLKAAAVEQLPVAYPGNPDMPGITNTEFMGPLRREDGRLVARNTVVVSPGRCDRSPCGTGSSAPGADACPRRDQAGRDLHPRIDHRQPLHLPGRRADPACAIRCGDPRHRRAGLDHRPLSDGARPDRSLPPGLYACRHLVRRLTER